MTDWTDDTASIHAFISDIPSQMHPSPIIMWQVILIFMLFVLSARGIKFWLVTIRLGLVFHQSCLIHRHVPHFDSLILSNTFLSCAIFFLSFGWQHLHSCLRLICFCIFKSIKYILAIAFWRNFVFSFLSSYF